MLRWGRWTAVRVLGSFASVASGRKNDIPWSKNVREIKTRQISFTRRHSSSTASLGLGRVPSTDVTTTNTAAQPTPIKPDVTSLGITRDTLTGKRKFDAFTLRCSYGASRPLVSYLTKSEFSTLIALFGALSRGHHYLSSSPAFSLAPDHRLLLDNASRQDFGSWWEFVLEVGADQAVLGRRTSDADSYWLMLAHLSCCLSYFRSLRNCTTSTRSNEAPTKYLVHAHVHYIKLAKNHLDQAVHYDYLRRLLRIYEHIHASPFPTSSSELDPQHSSTVDMVQDNMTNVIKSLLSKSHFRFESRLASLVWRVIGTVEFNLSQTKSLLHALRSRFMSPSSSSRTSTLGLDPVLALREAILGHPTPDDSWSYQEACSILRDAHAWDKIRILANQSQPCAPTGANSRLGVLLALHQIEQSVQKSQNIDSVVLDRWWDVWMAILGAEAGSHEHRDVSSVDRATLLAFLRLAALCRSSRVILGSERLLAVYPTVVLPQDGIGAAGMVSGFKNSLSVSLGAAYVCLGASNLTVLGARLRAAGFGPDHHRLPRTYVSNVIEFLLELRAPRAAWDITSQVYAEIPSALVGAVAYACARSGLIAEAISFLSDTRLGPNKRRRIALVCLFQLARQRVVLTRRAALDVCEALGPNLDRTPLKLRHVTVRMALDAGLVQLGGLMGTRWQLSPQTQRSLAARLVKARLPLLALRVVNKSQMTWLFKALKRAGYRNISLIGLRADKRFTRSENDATRKGNIHIVRSSTSKRRRLGGRAQLRATLAALARLLRNGVPHGASSRSRGETSSWSGGERASFEPDAVTLNIILRALGRSPSCVSSSDWRAVFDLLARSGCCGQSAHGNHFGTEADYVLKGFASSAVALVGLIPSAERQLSFVRHLRPLLKIFLFGFRIRGDQEGVRVVTSVLRAEDVHWRHASRPTRAGV